MTNPEQAPRELWVVAHDDQSISGDAYYSEEDARSCTERLREAGYINNEIVHLREVDPEADKLRGEMLEALKVGKEALAHDAPGSCWATGPLTGNYIEDLIVCPGCRAIASIEAAIAKAEGRE
jgi:hypothetical protein